MQHIQPHTGAYEMNGLSYIHFHVPLGTNRTYKTNTYTVHPVYKWNGREPKAIENETIEKRQQQQQMVYKKKKKKKEVNMQAYTIHKKTSLPL